MMFRKVDREDIKVGAVIYFYNDNYIDGMPNNGYIIKDIVDGYVVFEGFEELNRTYTIKSILNLFTIEDKPTGIPTFDGDLPQGTKLDQGKLKPTLLLDDMPLAINEILKVLQFGAEKYSEGNWLKVPNGIDRYRNAADRHRLAIDELDDESGMMHLAHEATSVLMLLELKLREKRDANKTGR